MRLGPAFACASTRGEWWGWPPRVVALRLGGPPGFGGMQAAPLAVSEAVSRKSRGPEVHLVRLLLAARSSSLVEACGGPAACPARIDASVRSASLSRRQAGGRAACRAAPRRSPAAQSVLGEGASPGAQRQEALPGVLHRSRPASLNAAQVTTCWMTGMPPSLGASTKMLLLEGFFAFAGDDALLQKQEIDQGLSQLLSGQISVVTMIRNASTPEQRSALWSMIDDTVGVLKVTQKTSGRQMKRRTTFGEMRSSFLSNAAAVISSDVAPSGLEAAGDTDAEFRSEAWGALNGIFSPSSMKEWIRNEPTDANLIMLYELGQCLLDLESASTDYQVNLHNTTFKARFYNTLFDGFPYIVDWISDANEAELANAERLFR
ncbi:hypothetical protein CYMTET_34957, partial [Cymbomonas tetramitiformis]